MSIIIQRPHCCYCFNKLGKTNKKQIHTNAIVIKYSVFAAYLFLLQEHRNRRSVLGINSSLLYIMPPLQCRKSLDTVWCMGNNSFVKRLICFLYKKDASNHTNTYFNELSCFAFLHIDIIMSMPS